MSATSHTKRVVLVALPSGEITESTEEILRDLGYFELSICGRHRVYPRLPSQTVTLNTGAGADQWGPWTEVIPANTVPFTFTVHSIVIETISATGIYVIQVGDCAAATTPGANDVQGEVRHRATSPANQSTDKIPFGCREILANRRVMARVMNDSGGDNCTISVVVRRYIPVALEVEKWPTFPW